MSLFSSTSLLGQDGVQSRKAVILSHLSNIYSIIPYVWWYGWSFRSDNLLLLLEYIQLGFLPSSNYSSFFLSSTQGSKKSCYRKANSKVQIGFLLLITQISIGGLFFSRKLPSSAYFTFAWLCKHNLRKTYNIFSYLYFENQSRLLKLVIFMVNIVGY